MHFKISNHARFILLLAVFLLIGCGTKSETSSSEQKLKVVATTTLVGDVVTQIGDDLVDVSVLLPIGTDPHSFNPTPKDVAKLSEADIIFANGAGLEEFLEPLLESAGATDRVAHVSNGIELLEVDDDEEEHAEDADQAEPHNHEGLDPHTWTDPNNVIIWVKNIESKLSEADPENAAVYAGNAQQYTAELIELDAWIRQQIEQIPAERRKLVTDHMTFGYFVRAYGLEQVGALISGYSTLAEPTAQELAALEDAIAALAVPAIFVGNTVNPALSERVAQDTNTQLVYVYTGSLSNPGGEAATYLDYMRYNTRAFVEALTANP